MAIDKAIKEVLKDNQILGKDIKIVKSYIEASKVYESLVRSGLATKRGNNLISKDRIYKSNTRFNRA